MKVWLNDLKEGDKFYHILLDNVYQCEHLGDAHNMNFRMPRIKFRVLDKDILFNNNALGDIHEAFVNQYVYDNKEEAEKECLSKLKIELTNIKDSIAVYKSTIENLEARKKSLQNKISEFEKNGK